MDAITTRPKALTETLRYAFGNSALGTFLVAVSEKGVAAIVIGDRTDALRRELAESFPQAQLVADPDGLVETIGAVAALLDAPHMGLDFPLDIRGSDIELAVWQALRDVPPGETTTYGAIAKALPLPATAQEVGVACAVNVLAVAIPCHRVVKADDSISGYRWGVQRKKKLINREAVA